MGPPWWQVGVWARSSTTIGDNLQPGRVYQDSLSAEDYRNQLMDRLDDIPDSRFDALRALEKEKLRVAKMYNNRVKEKSF
jgi:hypothetical protein